VRIALVRPHYHTHLVTPQLGLGYLSSYLREHGVRTRIVDGLLEDLSTDELAARCEPFEVVGVNCLSDYFPEVIELTRELKRRGKTVIVGGPHASGAPGPTLERSGADFVVVGEGEVTLHELLVALAEGGDPAAVPGVAAASDGGASLRERPFVADLDSLPFPDWAAMHPHRYRHAPHGAFVKRFPVAPIVSSRGCPYECTFCASPRLWRRSIRFRSPGNVVDEIDHLVRRFGVREIHFEDDNLTVKRRHVEGICELLLSRGIDVSWAAPNGVRVDTLDVELLTLMKRSGCYFLAFGVESGNQEILDRIKKGTDLETIRRAIEAARSVGIQTQAFNIFGLPGETAETIEQTIDFNIETGLDRAQFLLLDVLVGSELYDELADDLTPSFDRRSYQEITWCPPTVDPEVLAAAPARAFRRFFLRPRQLAGLLRRMRPRQARFVLRRLRDFRIFGSVSRR
jgi:radical SAM superfamily enzyme YgiQ (UPF0313 family)